MNYTHLIKRSGHWLGCFLLYLSSILLIGGLVGACLYASIGSLTHPQISLDLRVCKGFANGFFYAGIWATGISIVLCVMRAHKERARS